MPLLLNFFRKFVEVFVRIEKQNLAALREAFGILPHKIANFMGKMDAFFLKDSGFYWHKHGRLLGRVMGLFAGGCSILAL